MVVSEAVVAHGGAEVAWPSLGRHRCAWVARDLEVVTLPRRD